ncbi:MAG: AsmA-like C-terminal region-containing protein [Candidatus Methylacidiphilales bacterium]
MRVLIKNLFLLVCSTTLVFFGLGWLVQNYMQSEEFIEKISRSASETLGGSLHIDHTKVELLRGVTFFKVTLDRDPPLPHPLVEMDYLRIRYNPFKLLLGEMELPLIRLEKPRLHFQQTPQGDWWWLRSFGEAHPTFDAGWVTFRVLLNDFATRDGSVLITLSDGRSIFHADGIVVEGDLLASDAGNDARGRLHVIETRLGSRFLVSGLHGDLRFKDNLLTMPNFSGQTYGGQVSGNVEVDLRDANPEFQMNLNLTNLDIPTLVEQWGGSESWMQGKLQAFARIEGNFKQPELMQVIGNLNVNQAVLNRFSFLKDVEPILPSGTLAEVTFERISGNYKISEKILTLYDIEAVSSSLQLTGSGTVTLSGDLNLDMRLLLGPERTRSIPSEMLARFTPRNDGFYSITFKLSGTLEKPLSNLPAKLDPTAAALSPALSTSRP